MRRVLRVLVAPRLLPLHLLGLGLTTAAVLLGLWQLDAWQDRREAAVRDLTAMAPVPLDQLLSPDEPFPSDAVGRPVEVEGAWVAGATFFVSDRDLAGRTGYWVVTPLAVCTHEPAGSGCPQDPALLVVRGWTPEPTDAPAEPAGPAAVAGWLQPPEGSGAAPDSDPADDVFPELRIGDAIQRVDQDLYGAYLIAEQTTPAGAIAGLEPVTPDSLPEPGGTTALRNLLYALEWWVFAAFALVVWWRWTRDEAERLSQAPRADVPGR